MLKITGALLIATTVACISFVQCGVIEINIADTRFFNKLSVAEKRAIISLAIAFHDAPDSSDENSVFPTPPIKPRSEEIPPTLYTAMMNGEVPKQWMKNFIRWLKWTLRITDKSLNEYRHNETYDELCSENKCYNLSDVGQKCCPFG